MNEGYSSFYTVCDTGVGMWCGEIINGLRNNQPDLLLQCITPHEEWATKWTPDLRDRYFKVLEECTHMSAAAEVGNRLAPLKAYVQMINVCDTIIAVYDPKSNRGDYIDQAMLYAAGAGKRIIMIHPDTMDISFNFPVL